MAVDAQRRRLLITIAEARVNDVIVTQFPGGSPREGRITAVFGEGEHRHFDVLWSDAHESMLYPDPCHTEIRCQHPRGSSSAG